MTSGDAADAERLRNALIDQLCSSGVINTAPVEAAMRAVPRHLLVETAWLPVRPNGGPSSATTDWQPHRVEAPIEPDVLRQLYADVPVPTRVGPQGPTSSASQPSLVAHMLELLDLQPGMRVLEIGAGTGYNAALIAELVGDQRLVQTVDSDAEVVRQTRRLLARAGYPDVRVLSGDGAEGHPESAPYARIVATAGCPDISSRWIEQLAPDGLALVPLEHAGFHPLTRVERVASRATSRIVATGRVVGWSGFMPLRGSLDGQLRWRRSPLRAEEAPKEERELPLPRAVAAATGPGPWPGFDFHYYVALVDHRACAVVALADADGCVRADFQRQRLIVTGDTSALEDDLVRHAEAWHQLGQPAASDWSSDFVPLADREGAVEDRDSMDVVRVHHVQRVRRAFTAP